MIPIHYNTRSLRARRVSTFVTVLGLSLVAFVFGAVLMLSHGIQAALRSGGRPDNVVLLRRGANAELVSVVPRDAARAISTLPEIALDAGGEPLVSGEVVVLVALTREDGALVNATARGVSAASYRIRPSVRIVEGRAPRPGTREIAIGSGLGSAAAGAHVGGELSFAQASWPVVGRMEADGAAFESELWADAERLAQAFNRAAFSSAVARLREPALFEAFRARVDLDPRFTLEVVREDLYWEEQSSSMVTFIRVLGLFVSIVFGAGAVLGAMITMYAQVAARTREIGMMRAIGFSRRSVLASMLFESALLGLAGGLLGAAAALAMRWVRIRTLNFQTFSEIRFGFAPTPGIALAVVLFGIGMGLAGGLLPAIRAARLPILDATRG